MRNSNKKLQRLVITALMLCLVLISTSFFKIPVPMTQGYVHLGDGFIFLAIMILGKRDGAIAAGIGSALGDILGGYAFWAPWTFGLKFIMAFIAGLLMEKSSRSRGLDVLGMILGGLVMSGGYFLAERVIYGNWITAALAIPWNIGQFTIGAVLAMLLSGVLYKTPAKKFFIVK